MVVSDCALKPALLSRHMLVQAFKRCYSYSQPMPTQSFYKSQQNTKHNTEPGKHYTSCLPMAYHNQWRKRRVGGERRGGVPTAASDGQKTSRYIAAPKSRTNAAPLDTMGPWRPQDRTPEDEQKEPFGDLWRQRDSNLEVTGPPVAIWVGPRSNFFS